MAQPLAGQADETKRLIYVCPQVLGRLREVHMQKRLRFARACMLTGVAGVFVSWAALSGSALAQVFGGPPGAPNQAPAAPNQPPAAQNPVGVKDPGVRGGAAGAGGALQGLNADELAFFAAAGEVFAEIDSVSGTVPGEDGAGLGPRFNLN